MSAGSSLPEADAAEVMQHLPTYQEEEEEEEEEEEYQEEEEEEEEEEYQEEEEEDEEEEERRRGKFSYGVSALGKVKIRKN